jgi:hypothetical protein
VIDYYRARRVFAAEDLRNLAARAEAAPRTAYHAPALHRAADLITAPLSPDAADLLRDLLDDLEPFPGRYVAAADELRALLPPVEATS